jgi:hypothetical protein
LIKKSEQAMPNLRQTWAFWLSRAGSNAATVAYNAPHHTTEEERLMPESLLKSTLCC